MSRDREALWSKWRVECESLVASDDGDLPACAVFGVTVAALLELLDAHDAACISPNTIIEGIAAKDRGAE